MIKIINKIQTWIEHYVKLITFFFSVLFIVVILYSLYLSLFVKINERLEFLGEFIGVPASISITAMFSTYEFHRNTRHKTIKLLSDNLYKILLGLSSIKRNAVSIAGIYYKTTPKKILEQPFFSSVSSLSDSPALNIVSINLDLLKERIYINSSLRYKLYNNVKDLQHRFNYILDEIGYIGNYKNASFKIKIEHRQDVYNACFIIMSKSLELIQLSESLQDNIYRYSNIH